MHKKYLILLTLTLSLFTTACHNKDDSKKDTNIALLGVAIADLLSGQCLQIEKVADGSYKATGYNVPKGGCNTATLGKVTTTNINAALESSEKSYNSVIDILEKAGSDCTTLKNTVIADRNAETASALQTAASSSCTGLGFKLQTSYYGSRVFCNSNLQLDAYKAKYKYVFTSNVLTDMAATYTAQKGILTTLAGGSTASFNKWTDEQKESYKLMTSSELPTFLKYYPIFSKAVGASANSCATAIVTANPNFKPLLVSIGITGFFNVAAIAQTRPVATGGASLSTFTGVTDVTNFPPKQPFFQCVYGDNAGTPTSPPLKCDNTTLPLF